MDRLPSDVTLIILRKLATQDPQSFLQAVSTCKRLRDAATEDPSVWRDAHVTSAPVRISLTGRGVCHAGLGIPGE